MAGQIRTRQPLHATLLIVKRNMAHLRRLHMARKILRATLRIISARRAIRHLQAGASGRHGNRAMHQSRRLNLRTIQCLHLRTSAPKLIGVHAAYATVHPGIAIRALDIRVADNITSARERSASETTVEPTSPPRMEHLKRRERHPTQSTESKPNSNPATPTKEAHKRRRPGVVRKHGSRIPAPSTHTPEPAAVMIRRPAPRIRAHPGPAIVVFPNPAARLIRRPTRLNVGLPDVSVIRI